uniref:PH domain-containing protein n=1 Tax=Haptolina brevifila TaxID=156173 RepID=A0A7S2JS61_9EUKA
MAGPSSFDSTKAQLDWMEAAEQEVAQDDLAALLLETRGVLEKLAEGNLKLGTWQMVLWQPRWVFASTEALCYQKITADERPIGKEKRIPFSDVQMIEELEFGEFVLQCSKRDYTFKAPDEVKCQVFVNNLRQLRERWRLSSSR